ncbi:MAG: hypothetical protein OXE77_11460 [Flavobacteriaceae bacterium]|nr:hypothetical protein [Flavobacteriaceae bacterium]MCY4266617.1 hypothetical protein [Flavobacteriaceae bacterium]MCY4297956.1 hypothetical protein [Flavobacteriaceae bacterium]
MRRYDSGKGIYEERTKGVLGFNADMITLIESARNIEELGELEDFLILKTIEEMERIQENEEYLESVKPFIEAYVEGRYGY